MAIFKIRKANQLTSTAKNSVTTTYAYDDWGRNVSRYTAGQLMKLLDWRHATSGILYARAG